MLVVQCRSLGVVWGWISPIIQVYSSTMMDILGGIDGNYRVLNLFLPWLYQFTITLIEFGLFLLPTIFHIKYTIIKRYYPGEQVNLYIQSLINIIQENNWVIDTKKG